MFFPQVSSFSNSIHQKRASAAAEERRRRQQQRGPPFEAALPAAIVALGRQVGAAQGPERSQGDSEKAGEEVGVETNVTGDRCA